MTAAIFAVSLALGTWVGFRFGETKANLDHDLRTYLLATIPSEPSAPPAGAGPTQAPGATGFGVNN